VTFLNAPGRIITREKLLESTRAFDDIYDRAIDVQILRLRRKIETDPKKPALLRTERGAGYIFDTDIEHLWT
jgi:DNA-binding response OmpR family regulator